MTKNINQYNHISFIGVRILNAHGMIKTSLRTVYPVFHDKIRDPDYLC